MPELILADFGLLVSPFFPLATRLPHSFSRIWEYKFALGGVIDIKYLLLLRGVAIVCDTFSQFIYVAGADSVEIQGRRERQRKTI